MYKRQAENNKFLQVLDKTNMRLKEFQNAQILAFYAIKSSIDGMINSMSLRLESLLGLSLIHIYFRSYSGMCHSRPAAERAEKAGSHRGRDSEDKETASRGRGAEIKGHQPGLLEKIPYDRRGGHESSLPQERGRQLAGRVYQVGSRRA